MVLSLYVMPITGTGTRTDMRRPKYRDSIFPFPPFQSMMYDYGDEPQCLVGIVDITAAADTALKANSDVFPVPANLDSTVSAVNTRNAIRTQLEANEFPGTWVQTTTSYREIVLMVGSLCQFAQRYQGLVGGRWFSGTVHVNQNFSVLTQAQQDGISTTAQSFGFTTTILQPTSVIRAVLLDMSSQYQAAQLPLVMAGVSLYTL